MQKLKNATANEIQITKNAPLILLKLIGSGTFKINVYASPSAKETAEQKLFRVIEREVRKNA